jgi:hypothetical protein
MSSAARSKPQIRRCDIRTVLTVHRREGQKMRRRNFPKGYAEMLEKQHNQLVCCVQEMYQRLRKASLWEGELLDESSGRPLTHDILAGLNLLEPQEDGSDAEFIERPRSIPMPDGVADDAEKTPAASSQESSQPTPQSHTKVMFIDSDVSAQTSPPTSPTETSSLSTLEPQHSLDKPTSRPQRQETSKQPLPILSPPIQLDLDLDPLWTSPLYEFSTSRSQVETPMYDTMNTLNSTNWCFDPPALLPPFTAHLPSLFQDVSNHKRTGSAPRPSLCHDWLGNGVGFDSSDFMSDFHQLSPQDTTEAQAALCRPRRAGSLS